MVKFLSFIFLFICNLSFSQVKVTIEIPVPDSIKQICDKTLLGECGKDIMTTCIKYVSCTGTKSTYQDGKERLDYKISYAFSYPEVKEATFPLTFIYAVYSGKGHLQSGRFLRFDHSDLPKDIQVKGINLINLDSVKTNVIKEDSLMKGQLFEFVLGQDGFYWHFHRFERDARSGIDMESYKYYNVIADPYTGKITSVYSY